MGKLSHSARACWGTLYSYEFTIKRVDNNNTLRLEQMQGLACVDTYKVLPDHKVTWMIILATTRGGHTQRAVVFTL